MNQPQEVHGSIEALRVSEAQSEALRRVCRRLATIGGAVAPERLDTFDELLAALTSLTEVCARRLKNRHDNTDLRAVREVREEAEDLERLKSRFIRNVSHELRTPLASIDGFARALLKMETVGPTESNPELVSPEIRRQFLTIVSQEAQRLGKLIEDVLDLSEVEHANSAHEPATFCARELFEDAMTAMSPAPGSQSVAPQIVIRLSPEPDGPTIYADRAAMVEVLRHLINNAQKFSAGLPIVLGAEVVSIAPEHAHSADDSGPRARVSMAARIYVKDKGIGIPKEELECIFQKFYKVEHPGATFPGTGLGLSIVRALVNQNNGQVWAASELGKGSTFYVLLPGESAGGSKESVKAV